MPRRTINPWNLFVAALVPNWILERRELSPGAKLCYARLCQYAGRHGVAFPSQNELASALGVTTRMVKRYYRELRELRVGGHPAPLIEMRRGGYGLSYRITFLVHPWMGLNAQVDMAFQGFPQPVVENPVSARDTNRAKAASGDVLVPSSGDVHVPTVAPENAAKSKRERLQKAGQRAARESEKRIKKAGRRPTAAAIPSQTRRDDLLSNLSRSLAMPGADVPGIRRGALAAVRARIDALAPAEREKLRAFGRWLQSQGASDEELQAIVADLLARPEIMNPYAYYAPGSEARRRIRQVLS